LFVLIAGGGTVVASSNAGPNDSLYGVKRIAENTIVALTFSPEGKSRALLKQADERLNEIEKDLDNGQLDQLEPTFEQAREQAQKSIEHAQLAQNEGKYSYDLTEKLQQHLDRQQTVFSAIIASAPEEAKAGLEQAQEASKKGLENAIYKLETTGKPTDPNIDWSDTEGTENAGEDNAENDSIPGEQGREQAQEQKGNKDSNDNTGGDDLSQNEEDTLDNQSDEAQESQDVQEKQETSL